MKKIKKSHPQTKSTGSYKIKRIWDKVLTNGPSKIFGRQP